MNFYFQRAQIYAHLYLFLKNLSRPFILNLSGPFIFNSSLPFIQKQTLKLIFSTTTAPPHIFPYLFFFSFSSSSSPQNPSLPTTVASPHFFPFLFFFFFSSPISFLSFLLSLTVLRPTLTTSHLAAGSSSYDDRLPASNRLIPTIPPFLSLMEIKNVVNCSVHYKPTSSPGLSVRLSVLTIRGQFNKSPT